MHGPRLSGGDRKLQTISSDQLDREGVDVRTILGSGSGSCGDVDPACISSIASTPRCAAAAVAQGAPQNINTLLAHCSAFALVLTRSGRRAQFPTVLETRRREPLCAVC